MVCRCDGLVYGPQRVTWGTPYTGSVKIWFIRLRRRVSGLLEIRWYFVYNLKLDCGGARIDIGHNSRQYLNCGRIGPVVLLVRHSRTVRLQLATSSRCSMIVLIRARCCSSDDAQVLQMIMIHGVVFSWFQRLVAPRIGPPVIPTGLKQHQSGLGSGTAIKRCHKISQSPVAAASMLVKITSTRFDFQLEKAAKKQYGLFVHRYGISRHYPERIMNALDSKELLQGPRAGMLQAQATPPLTLSGSLSNQTSTHPASGLSLRSYTLSPSTFLPSRCRCLSLLLPSLPSASIHSSFFIRFSLYFNLTDFLLIYKLPPTTTLVHSCTKVIRFHLHSHTPSNRHFTRPRLPSRAACRTLGANPWTTRPIYFLQAATQHPLFQPPQRRTLTHTTGETCFNLPIC